MQELISNGECIIQSYDKGVIEKYWNLFWIMKYDVQIP